MIRWLAARFGYVPRTSPAPVTDRDDETSVEKELRECRRLLRRLREDVDYHDKAIARIRGHVTGGIRHEEDEDDEDLGDLLPSRRYRGDRVAAPVPESDDDDEEEED